MFALHTGVYNCTPTGKIMAGCYIQKKIKLCANNVFEAWSLYRTRCFTSLKNMGYLSYKNMHFLKVYVYVNVLLNVYYK